MKKGFALPLIIALIIAVGLIGFIVYLKFWHNNTPFMKAEIKMQDGTLILPSTSPNETANWKTYSTDDLTIKAPEDWKKILAEGNPNKIIDIQKTIDSSNNYQDIQVISNTISGTSAHELITKDSTYTKGSGGYDFWNEVLVQFNSKSVNAYEVLFKDGHWVLFSQSNGLTGENFLLYSKQKPSPADRALLLKILSTFKFLQ